MAMPTFAKNLADQYDSSVQIFHNQSSNLPLLHTWIDELLALTKKSSYNKETPTTESLVESIQRYNAIFMELLRQTSIFSDTLTKLIAKAWNGNMYLLDNMIKSYHKYVRFTVQTQNSAQQMLREKAKESLITKNKEEESVLERTVLRARIRGLEAEMEAMRMTQHSTNSEVRYLRIIVDEFIKSNDTYNPVNSGTTDKLVNNKVVTFGRKDTIEAGRQNLRALTVIESDMSNLMCLISKEEDRQRLILQDIRCGYFLYLCLIGWSTFYM
jgi:hypothetical protein